MSTERESKKVKLEPTEESYQLETSDTSSQVSFRGAELHFLGTSLSVPTRERNTSAIALKLEGEVWLFDCGEGVQKQLLFTSVPRARISRIFITHMHGDHCFGLPPLLCSLSIVEHLPRPHIYGPIGIREFIEKTLLLTRSPTIPSANIHEFTPTQFPDKGTLLIHEDNRWSVRAGWIRHKIPCLGFVIEERTSQGTLLMDRARKLGLNPGKMCAQLKNGQSIQLENGTIIHPDQVMTRPRKGRKFVILGDNSDASSLKLDAEHADIVVHESTLDQDMQDLAISNGHSTSRMAGLFAKQIKAKTLVLTHFSPKFHSDKRSKRTDAGMRTDSTLDQETLPLVEQARAAFESDSVFAAKDRWWISIPRHELILRTIEEDQLVSTSQMKDV